jgi:hypothetical protein
MLNSRHGRRRFAAPCVGILKGRDLTIPEMKSEDFSISPSIFGKWYGLLRIRDQTRANGVRTGVNEFTFASRARWYVSIIFLIIFLAATSAYGGWHAR